MRKLVLILGLLGCAGSHRAGPIASTTGTSAPSPPLDCNGSGAASKLDDPEMNGSFGGPGLPSGGGCGSGARASTLQIGAPISSSPDFNDAVFRDVIGSHKDELHACYDRRVTCPRLLDYVMRVAITIHPDGSVVAPCAETVNTKIRDCMVGILGTLHFPKPTHHATIDVSYPLTFHTVSENASSR